MYYVKLIIIFVIVWWILFFMALPIGVKKPINILPGQDRGAPDKPRLWVKFFVVSVISIVFTIIIKLIIQNNWLGL